MNFESPDQRIIGRLRSEKIHTQDDSLLSATGLKLPGNLDVSTKCDNRNHQLGWMGDIVEGLESLFRIDCQNRCTIVVDNGAENDSVKEDD